MFSHITIGSNDLEKSRKFYNAIFEALSIAPAGVSPTGRLVYAQHGSRLMIGKPINGKPATAANGGTIAFSAKNKEEVDAWHKAGVANGGEAIEDPPGIRHTPNGDLYLAYLRDPDGNKLCAMYQVPAA